jgi:F-type H+-transporting ATPase subunit b
MPQFDPVNFMPQFIWLLGIFAVLYFLFIRTTLPKLAHVVDERTATIDAELSAAASARDAAANASSGNEQALTAARTSASQTIGSAKAEAAKSTDVKLKSVEEMLAKKLGDADARISASRAEALAGVKDVAATAAADIVAKLTGQGVAADDAASAVRALS